MHSATGREVPWPLWPLHAVWRILTLILGITGRLLALLLGVALMVAGIAVAMSVVGAPLGIPLAALGFLLVVRALF